jgi:hypothetical protein
MQVGVLRRLIKSMKTFFKLKVAYCVFLFVLSCGSVSILGPRDNPQFKHFEWSSIDVKDTYRGIGGDEEYVAKVRSAKKISDGFIKIENEKISPMSFPSQKYIQLKSVRSGEWDMMMVSTTNFVLSSKEDNYKSYLVKSSDDKFYQWLVELCLEDIRSKGINAEIKNIRLF